MSKAARAFAQKNQNYYSAMMPSAYPSYSGTWAANDDLPQVEHMPADKTVVIRDPEWPSSNPFDRSRVRAAQHQEIASWCKANNLRLTCFPTLMQDKDGRRVYVITFKKTNQAVMAKLMWG